MKKIKSKTETNSQTQPLLIAKPAFIDKCFTKKSKLGYTTGDILRILKIPKHKLDYLFSSRKIDAGDILLDSHGKRIYSEVMVNKIRRLLK